MAKKVSALLAEHQADPVYWEQWIIGDFADELIRRMGHLGLNRKELAERIGKSQAYVTKALRGDANFTIRSMTKLARAVDSVVRIHLAPLGSSTKWLDVFETTTAELNSAAQLQRVAFGGNGWSEGASYVAVAGPGGANPAPAKGSR